MKAPILKAPTPRSLQTPKQPSPTPPTPPSQFDRSYPHAALRTKHARILRLSVCNMDRAKTASSFWAQKREEVKAPTASTLIPTVATPKQNGELTEVKPRMVLKGEQNFLDTTDTATESMAGMTNGASATFTQKKTNWADSDDDEDFIASLPDRKSPRITALEAEVVQQVAQIVTLEATVSTKDVRIAELEVVVKEKDTYIADLESNVEEKETTAEQLKTENHTQFLYVQELVGEVDEKSRRVHQLESELDEKCVRIRELESKLESESESLLAAEHIQNDTDSSSQDKIDAAPDVTTIDPLPEAVLHSEAQVDGVEESSIQALPNKYGPTVNESKYPKLWSPDMPKNVAPVKKPKVLKMAIDTSKYVKKAPSAMAKKSESLNGKTKMKPTYGQSTRHRAKTSVIPKFKVDQDIRHMSHADRVLFANGPEVEVMLGSASLMRLPKYIFMQCSSKAYKYFINKPDATSIIFSTGSMDVDAAMAHLHWMDEMTYQGRVYSLTLNADEKFDAKNLKICQAARVMGLNNTYVGHFTKVICDRVRKNNASTGFLSLICELAVPDNDPIFDCLANNLVNQQNSKGAHPAQPDELLAKHPHLGEQMSKIEQFVQVSREGDRRKGRFGSHGREEAWEQGVGGKNSTAS
ncbi:hypothetical protein HBI24_166480 [Parastagonospora nodorum]|nr:hypothetical protein HBI95_234280 [Parastagonospora nodorum]KAH4285031.1 hypothetical protein HBI02_238290 [Parastagonospora nodorum]KAH4286524.1 hypothetical protein HBI01_238480 [Parastagonospora nodorum]KAH4319960.1 hypothetical protein HBI00_235420 [Parastagonospora nodorum]KAH4364789.1 hypothetical protein HBH94_156810 [Parastagonospora nodorum]